METTGEKITLDFDKAYALIDEFKRTNNGDQGWPHMWLVAQEDGSFEGKGFGGRTDLVPSERMIILLNARWKSAEELKYAFWMAVRNRIGSFDLYKIVKV